MNEGIESPEWDGRFPEDDEDRCIECRQLDADCQCCDCFDCTGDVPYDLGDEPDTPVPCDEEDDQ